MRSEIRFEPLSRRQFLTTVGKAALTGAALPLLPTSALAGPAHATDAESAVKVLHASLTPKQRELICLPWEHANRSRVQANWGIVKTYRARTKVPMS